MSDGFVSLFYKNKNRTKLPMEGKGDEIKGKYIFTGISTSGDEGYFLKFKSSNEIQLYKAEKNSSEATKEVTSGKSLGLLNRFMEFFN